MYQLKFKARQVTDLESTSYLWPCFLHLVPLMSYHCLWQSLKVQDLPHEEMERMASWFGFILKAVQDLSQTKCCLHQVVFCFLLDFLHPVLPMFYHHLLQLLIILDHLLSKMEQKAISWLQLVTQFFLLIQISSRFYFLLQDFRHLILLEFCLLPWQELISQVLQLSTKGSVAFSIEFVTNLMAKEA